MSNNNFILLAISILLLSSILMFWELDNVDFEGSEDIYVSDSINYLRNDPFTVPRHHLRKPHAPASPHPFLVQMLTTEVIKRLGFNLFSVRFLQAGLSVITVAIFILFTLHLTVNKQIALWAGFIYATLPLTVRYGKMAVLDPVLAFFTLLTFLWLWLAYKNKKISNLFALFSGIGLGLCASTKLTGIFVGLEVFLFVIYLWFVQSKKSAIRISVFIGIGFVITFFAFNDPYSYWYGWTNFSDPKYKNIGVSSVIKGFLDWKYWGSFAFALIGIFTTLLLISSLFFFFRSRLTAQKVLLLAWIFPSIIYLLINPAHITGLSSEWSYLPLFLPLSIIMAKKLNEVTTKRKKWATFIVCLFIISVIPGLYYFGLRTLYFPLPNHQGARNVVRGDLAVTSIIRALNQNYGESLVLLQLKGVILPTWLLNDNIKTEPFYHRIEEYDYIVTDNLTLASRALKSNFSLQKREQNVSEVAVYLLNNKLR